MYGIQWVCTGDTLRTDTTLNEGLIVMIDGYWMLCCEVTQDLFEWYMHYNPSEVKGTDLPVTNISKADVDSFCHQISISIHQDWRLPTKEEWLFAYHGGMFSEGYRYSGSNRLEWTAWCSSNSGGMLHNAAQLIPNELKMYDMDGNVAEMVCDGDTITYMGGSILGNGILRPDVCGFRIVCHQPLWFDKYGTRIFGR